MGLHPLAFAVGELPAVAGGRYESPLRPVLVAFKERGSWGLAGPLGERLAVATAALLGRAAVESRIELVPIPSRRAAVRERGLDTTLHLARVAARLLRRRVGLDVRVGRRLRLVRAVADQAGLDRFQRHQNLAGSLAASPVVPGVLGVLVDDVSTTGATLIEGQRAAVAAGWLPLGAAVVAHTPLRHS